ncbi:MAG: hypothetical protein LBU13_06290 [Synergistaceae bacterium]|jgi:hypothetical protein|nr:hypothetical protein [Synergistaceae bacterium]
MKSNFHKIAVMVLAIAALSLSAGLTAHADSASGYGYIGGYEEPAANSPGTVGLDPGEPWYRTVTSNDLTNPPFFGQNTVVGYLVSGDVPANAEHILELHPEFYPDWEKEKEALIESSIVGFWVWDGTKYVNCLNGSLGIVPYEYRQNIPGTNVFYLRCNVRFVMSSQLQSRPIYDANWENMYFKIPQLSPLPEEPATELAGRSVR